MQGGGGGDGPCEVLLVREWSQVTKYQFGISSTPPPLPPTLELAAGQNTTKPINFEAAVQDSMTLKIRTYFRKLDQEKKFDSGFWM